MGARDIRAGATTCAEVALDIGSSGAACVPVGVETSADRGAVIVSGGGSGGLSDGAGAVAESADVEGAHPLIVGNDISRQTIREWDWQVPLLLLREL